jgi:hypothetical protein
MKTIRQGDVLFIPEPNGVNLDVKDWKANGVIQEGEATGHHHKLAVLDAAEVFRPQWGNAMVRVGPNGVSIVHEEHATVTLDPSTTYRVHIAREYDYLRDAMRFVRD